MKALRNSSKLAAELIFSGVVIVIDALRGKRGQQ